jgi:hypothetical protein
MTRVKMGYKKSKAWCQPKHTYFVKRRCVGVQKWGPQDYKCTFTLGVESWGVPNLCSRFGEPNFDKIGSFLMVGNVLKNITIKWGCISKLLTNICNTCYWNWKGRKSNCQNDSQSLNQCLERFNRAYSC